jgi:uncharacterized protein (TIGR02271 family)
MSLDKNKDLDADYPDRLDGDIIDLESNDIDKEIDAVGDVLVADDLDRVAQQTIELYQERLVADKIRHKTGEVAIGKHVETKTATVSIPIEKERVVIERTPGNGATVDPSEANFQAGEVARMDIYEETPVVRKEAFLREQVSIRKEVDRETVEASELLRHEELDIDKQDTSLIVGVGSPLENSDIVAKKS